VRPLGLLGLAALGTAGIIGLWLVATRLSGITHIGPLGACALFAALVLAVAGISIFSLGTTFNYLVSLFHKRPIRQGLFGRPIFDPSLDHHFGWLGLVSLMCGLGIGAASLAFGLRGWPVSRLWLYFLGSALFILMGLQLVISWLQMRVLEELSRRDILAQNDLGGQG
jgi:hypothetical protein